VFSSFASYLLKEKDALGNIRHFEKRKIISGGGNHYPLLTRLKNDGLLSYRWEESTSGPPRKYYGLTEIGLTFLNELNSTWTELSDAVNLITNQKTAMNKTVNINLGGMFFI
jgi:PadR family transcriptional regulator PadR